ncbi:MAG: anhydro-N-acetylmuramic acid kinase [Alphaproteobacteria bacterium]|nr:anhydro-N-acetylmuramic acid kinase [Alphaproteobacteria bacterium]
MIQQKIFHAIGLMSGTSLDGVDIALIETDGENHIERKRFESAYYTKTEREAIRDALGSRGDSLNVRLADKIVTDKHISIVRNFVNNYDLKGKIDIIGFHGHTILHDPKERITRQIGNPQALADACVINVIGDLRQNDIANGGQGAPLLPLYHKALAHECKKPLAFVNIGGVSNITYINKDELLAFDCGPGNALIDDFMREHFEKDYDDKGELARSGTPDKDMVRKWMKLPYFDEAPPKSLDRNAWDIQELQYLPNADGVATLTQWTVEAINKAISLCPQKPKIAYITGGGRKNTFLMELLEKHLTCPVESAEEQGWNGDAMEAEGFAYLAVRSLQGLHITEPNTTGAPKKLTGGKLYKTNFVAEHQH